MLDESQVRQLLDADVVVEEKVDGANLGFSVDEAGQLRVQNRGHYLALDDGGGQWRPLRRWLSTRRAALSQALASGLMLFGEWCYAVHTIRYDALPDWFLAFDVFDRSAGEFWSSERRDELSARLGIAVVPEIARGRFRLDELKRLRRQSALGEVPVEGIYVRRQTACRVIGRAKLVSPGFVQRIDGHWSRRVLEANQLASAPSGRSPVSTEDR